MSFKFSTGDLLQIGMFVAILIPLTGFASAVHLFPYLELDPIFPLKYDTPFQILVRADLTGSLVVDITLSKDMKLLKGDLHWQGAVTRDSVYREKILVKINKPGIYEVTTTVRVSNQLDSSLMKFFPATRSIHFYAQEDTVAFFLARWEMEQAIRDSLVFPGVATRRYYAKRDTFGNAKRKELKMKDSLVKAIRQEMLHSDSIQYNQLDKYYTPEQVKRIKQYHLIFTPPQFDKIERLLRVEPSKKLSDEEIQKKMQMFRRHFTAQFQLDQKIIHETNSDSLNWLLNEKDSLRNVQRNEQNKLVKP